MESLFLVSANGQIEINWESLAITVLISEANYIIAVSCAVFSEYRYVNVNMLNIYQMKKGLEHFSKKRLGLIMK